MASLAIGETRKPGKDLGGSPGLILGNSKVLGTQLLPLADCLPGAVGLAAGCAARRLWLPANIDCVGVGPAEEAPLLIGLARHDLAAMLRCGIIPTRGSSRLAIFQGLVLGPGSHLAVALVELPTDLVADDAADHGANGSTRNSPASITAGDGGPCGPAGDGADDRARALLIARSASGHDGRQHCDHNDGR